MRFPELCTALEHELGKASVFDRRHPTLGVARADLADLVLWAHDGVFDVGGVDRGEFTTVRTFGTESEACEYILGALRRNANVREESPEERRRSKDVTDAYTESLLKEFDARRD